MKNLSILFTLIISTLCFSVENSSIHEIISSDLEIDSKGMTDGDKCAGCSGTQK